METLMKFFFLFMVMMSSVSEEVKNLTGTVGGNITLPDPVLELGFFNSYGGKTLAMVTEKKFQIVENISENKLVWNKNTGLFTITDLQREDSGIYTIDSKKGRVFSTSYKLTVYDSVSAPAVNTLSVSSDSCILLCAVDKAEETTLLWYKDEETVKQNSSVHSLSLTVHKQDSSSSYRCVAANPAENKTLYVNVKTSCGREFMSRTDIKESRHRVIPILISIISAVIIFFVAVIIKWKCLHKHKKTITTAQGPENTGTDIVYTDVHLYENRRSQQVESFPELPGNADTTHLKTVYDKLEVHRLLSVPTDPDAQG